MPRAVIYVRVSSDEQVKGMSLGFQKQDCLAYAQKKNLAVEQIFEEEGESAKFADRPQLIALLDYCRKHKKLIDALIVWKLDRLSRNQLDYYWLKRTLLDLGMTIHSATEPSMEDSSSISCKVFETFSALQAELDNTVRSERTRRGMEAKIMAGIFPWRSPLGYRSIQAKKHGEKKTRPDDPDPVLFPIIQSALRLYATGQYSQQDMLRLLDEKGLAAARGVKTHFQQVNRMLYQALDFYHGYLLNPWSGERVKGQQRAMLGDEEYWRIIAVRDGRGQGRAVKKIHDNPLFPLRRLLVCADCGRFYTGSVSHGHGGAYPYYRCQTKGCPASGKSIRPAEAETQVGELLARFQLTACFLSELKQSLSQVLDEVNRETTGKLALLDRQLAELVEKKKHIYEMREDGSYTKEEFLARKNTLESEIGRLEFERFTLAGQTYDLDEVFSYAQEFVQRFGNHWTQMPPEIWHRFHMLVFPDGISYHRERGYGTVKIGLIFGLFEDFQTTGSSLVPLAEVRLNLIHEELGKLAQIAQQFLTQAIP